MKRRLLLGLLVVAWAAGVAYVVVGMRPLDSPADPAVRTYLDEMFRDWQIHSFWNPDFRIPKRYQHGKPAMLRVFWAGPVVGFCSLDLALCTAYIRGANGNLVAAGALREFASSDLHEIAVRFVRELRLSDACRNHPRAERICALITDGDADPERFQYATVTIPLPPFDTPEAVRLRRSPTEADTDQLRQRLAEWSSAGGSTCRSEAMIPFYELRDSLVAVIRRGEGCADIVAVVGRNSFGRWDHTAEVRNPAAIVRLRPRILNAAMQPGKADERLP